MSTPEFLSNFTSELSVRNVLCDSYLEKPNDFNGHICQYTSILPVIRIFGILETGHKCCVHVHGVFPYIILKTGAPFTVGLENKIRRILLSLVAMKNQKISYGFRSAIHTIIPLEKKSMYGYHSSNEHFVKVEFFDPFYVRPLCDILKVETLGNSSFQLYEAHIPFILQFFIDNAIYGMDFVHLSNVRYRIPNISCPVESDNSNYAFSVSPLRPVTLLSVECDVFALDIINKQILEPSSYPGLNFIWQDEECRCEMLGRKLCIGSSQESRPMVPTDVENNYFRSLGKFLFDEVCTASDSIMNRSDTFEGIGSQHVESDSSTSFLLSDDFDEQAVLDDIFEVTNFDEADQVNWNEESDQGSSEDLEDMSQSISISNSPTCRNKLKRSSREVFQPNVPEPQDESSIPNRRLNENLTYRLPCMFESDDNESYPESSKNSYVQPINDKMMADESSNSPSKASAISLDCMFSSPSRRDSNDGREFFFNSPTKDSSSSKQPVDIRPSSICSFMQDDDVKEAHLVSARGGAECVSDESVSDEEMFNILNSYETDIGSMWKPDRPTDDDTAPYMCCHSVYGMQWTSHNKHFIPPQRRKSDEFKRNVKRGLNIDKPSTQSCSDQQTSIEYSDTKAFVDPSIRLPTQIPTHLDFDTVDLRYICVLSLEIFAPVRPSVPVPDPQLDPIIGIFYCVSTDICQSSERWVERGALINLEPDLVPSCSVSSRVECFSTENELFDAILSVFTKFDPDIVIGYNTSRYSWSYLIERAASAGRNLLSELSRLRISLSEYYCVKRRQLIRDISPRGRIIINVWRILRSEVALRSYCLSNTVHHILSRRFPIYSLETLTNWVLSCDCYLSIQLVSHFLMRASLNLHLLCRLDFFTRTAEMARVYGIQFTEVISRGSQFRVESMLLRLAHLKNFVAPTVSPAQRDSMCAAETLPLTMEPLSGLYLDPVIVLDFQSLYPSILIAYNYCFTTCLGKLSSINNMLIDSTGNAERIVLGGLPYTVPIDELKSMVTKKQIHISPVGGIFCNNTVRKGLLSQMLEQILDTRIMVKKAMKDYREYKRLSRLLDARQLALKLIANVTYGYTAANWSGRMPCVEVADAIVSKSRETLERAIIAVNSGDYCGARVIYGDTDSMFVLCPGATREEAFDIGERIAVDITNANPSPVKLKLEKVMQPLLLETKKRYVGMSYEKFSDGEGIFDAKGIETVRRDSSPLVSRIIEKALRLLFAGDKNGMIRYIDAQLSNLDKLNLSDFIFAREYHGRYAPTAVVAAKLIAEKRRAICPRDEPEYGERVPYVIVAGPPKCSVISCVREVSEFLASKTLLLNYDYYLHRQMLPALHRLLQHLPMQIECRLPSLNVCLGCRALGVYPWCRRCVHNHKSLLPIFFDLCLEQRLSATMNRLCRACNGMRSTDLEYSQCVNMTCLITQRRIFLKRRNLNAAVTQHGCCA